MAGIRVGIQQVARLQRGWKQHSLRVHVTELLDVVALDAVELDLQHPRLRPFATETIARVAQA